MAKIVFNGAEYSSVEEMPPEARQAYEQTMAAFGDTNQNGLPDMFEGMINAEAAQRGHSVNVFSVNGQTYNNLANMPPEVREAYQRALGALNLLGDRNQNGIPDIVEGAMNMQAQPGSLAQPLMSAGPMAPSVYPTAPKPPAIGNNEVEASDRNLRLFIIGGGLLLLLGAIAVLLAILVVNQYLR